MVDFMAEIQQREQERYYRCPEPEYRYGCEVVVVYTVDYSYIVVDKPSRGHVLYAGGYVRRYAYHSESCAGGASRHDIHGHQSAKEADEHSDGDAEEYHGEDINPHGVASE